MRTLKQVLVDIDAWRDRGQKLEQELAEIQRTIDSAAQTLRAARPARALVPASGRVRYDTIEWLILQALKKEPKRSKDVCESVRKARPDTTLNCVRSMLSGPLRFKGLVQDAEGKWSLTDKAKEDLNDSGTSGAKSTG